MRHRLVVLVAVLAVGGVAACTHTKADKPVPVPAFSPSVAVSPSQESVDPSAKPTAPGPGSSATGPGRFDELPR